MTQARDMSNLPRAADRGGWAPDPVSRFGSVLVSKWHGEAQDRPLAVPESRYRHSDAGKCSRALAYAALRIPSSNLPTPADTYVMRLGDEIHRLLQDAVSSHWPGAVDVEVEVGSGERSGHIDLVVHLQSEEAVWTVSIEAKSVDGFAYKMAVGERGEAEGPKYDHVIQASLNAKEINADEAVILYLARGGISRQAAARKNMDDTLRVTAEWTLNRDTYTKIAVQEIARVDAILGLLDEGTLPARKIPTAELPAGHLITKPKTGEWAVVDEHGLWQKGGTYWACAYCRWQDTCSLTEPTRTPVSVLHQIGVLSDEQQ